MKHLENFESYSIKINEDTSATGGPGGAVSGGDVNSQPASLPGVTTDPAYTNNGGVVGGYISTPYNAGTKNGYKGNVFQKIPTPEAKSKEHSSRTEGKSRASIAKAALKNILFNKDQDYTAGQGEVKKSKVMNFSDFEKKSDITTIKK